MNRKRLSREDSRDQTRHRLLDAAHQLVSKKGLDATSVEDITAAAGYSRGAFYSNFDTKHDLFIELLRRDHEKGSAEFMALMRDEIPLDEIRIGTSRLYSNYCRNHESFMSWTEARMLGTRDAKFRAKLNALMQEKRDQITGFIEYFYERAGTKPPVAPAAMAMGFMSLIEGVKLFELSSPNDMTPEIAQTILTLFMDSIIHAPAR
jgi:AcrR family transcriptional regulator